MTSENALVTSDDEEENMDPSNGVRIEMEDLRKHEMRFWRHTLHQQPRNVLNPLDMRSMEGAI